MKVIVDGKRTSTAGPIHLALCPDDRWFVRRADVKLIIDRRVDATDVVHKVHISFPG